ncbi:MAG: hypothetical protein GY913_11785 [Proteobacteria bacterium]|nr:hypothetical protein [Pseudomonadota bacterium]
MLLLLVACAPTSSSTADPCSEPLHERVEILDAIEAGGAWGIAEGTYYLSVASETEVSFKACGDVELLGSGDTLWDVDGGHLTLEGFTLVAGSKGIATAEGGDLTVLGGSVTEADYAVFAVTDDPDDPAGVVLEDVVVDGEVYLQEAALDVSGGSFTSDEVAIRADASSIRIDGSLVHDVAVGIDHWRSDVELIDVAWENVDTHVFEAAD